MGVRQVSERCCVSCAATTTRCYSPALMLRRRSHFLSKHTTAALRCLNLSPLFGLCCISKHYLHVEFTLKTDQAVLPVRIGGSNVWYFVPDHDQRQPREVSPLKLRALILMLVYGLIGHRALVYTHRRASSLLTLDLLLSL